MDEDLPFFPLFVDDWLGGTIAMTPAMKGAYISALIGQWKSREIQGIKDDPKALKVICGCALPSEVRAKFVLVEIEGRRYLRNTKLASVYNERKAVREKAKVAGQAGAKGRWGNAVANADANGGRIADAIGGSISTDDSKTDGSRDDPTIASQSPKPKGESTKDSKVESKKDFESNEDLSDKSDAEPQAKRDVPLEIFEHYRQVHNHPKAVFTPKRRALIRTRLKEHPDVDLKLAVTGCKRSPFHQGQNENGTIYDSIEVILRNTKQVEMFMAFATGESLVETAPKRFQTDAEKLAATDALYASYGAD